MSAPDINQIMANSCLNDPLRLDNKKPTVNAGEEEEGGEMHFVSPKLMVAEPKMSEVEKAKRRKRREEAKRLGLEVSDSDDSDSDHDNAVENAFEFPEQDAREKDGANKSQGRFLICFAVIILLIGGVVAILAATNQGCFADHSLSPGMAAHGYHYNSAGLIVDANGYPYGTAKQGHTPLCKVLTGVGAVCLAWLCVACFPCFGCQQKCCCWSCIPSFCKSNPEPAPEDTCSAFTTNDKCQALISTSADGGNTFDKQRTACEASTGDFSKDSGKLCCTFTQGNDLSASKCQMSTDNQHKKSN
jgi:hypothetical protein